MYDDEYATCARTHATLLIYPGDIDPPQVTARLGVEPTRWQRRGESGHRASRPAWVAPLNLWSLESKGNVESKDSRRHVDWLLDQLALREAAIRSLRAEDCKMAINCLWTTQSGHGGPMVPPEQMRKLADLDIELWFDFYGPYDEADA